MISQFVLAVLLGSGQDSTRKPSLTGDIRIHEGFESKVLGRSRTIRVWLPPGYDAKKSGGYPVIFLGDGQNVFDGGTSFIPNQEWRADETAQAMVGGGLIAPVILVAVDNGGMRRADEYLPSRGSYQGNVMGGEGDKFGDFLVTEVKPFVAKTYNATTSGKRTGLVGSSFGGLMAFHLGTTRPEEFGLLGVMSPSFWWNDKEFLITARNWKNKPDVKIWMDMGLEEGSTMVPAAREMRSVLVEKGFVIGRDLRFYEEARAGHNENAWAMRFDLCLQYLMEGIK